MTEALFALPVHLRKRLVAELESEALTAPWSITALKNTLGSADAAESAAAGLNSLTHMGLTAAGCAQWIKSVEKAAASSPRPDLVWSGPEVVGVHARDTRQVFEELLESAQRSIWACSYAFFDGAKAFKILAQRMDSSSDLDVVLLLNIQRKAGDKSIADDVVLRYADRFWKKEWPGDRRPTVYFDPRSLEDGGPGGVLHAKAIVTDEERVLITSANFTEAALDRNIELGLVAKDKALALSVISHFRALIDRKLVALLPQTS